MRYRRSGQPSLVQYTIFNPQLSAPSIRSIMFRVSASLSLSLSLSLSSSLYFRYEETEPLFLLRQIPRRANELSDPIDPENREREREREGCNRSRFFAGTYFVHDPLNEPSRNRYFFFLPFRSTESLLNKTLTLTTIRKIANHSKSSLR